MVVGTNAESMTMSINREAGRALVPSAEPGNSLASRVKQEQQYTWWIHQSPSVTAEVGTGIIYSMYLVNAVALWAVGALPIVVRTTGVGPLPLALLILVHCVWLTFVDKVLEPAAPHSMAAFQAIVTGNLLINESISVGIPAISGEPRSPLWAIPVMYACLNGSLGDARPVRLILIVHTLWPLLVVPRLLGLGCATEVAFGSTILIAALSGSSYHVLAMRTAYMRAIRAMQRDALAEAQCTIAKLERERLARELHDSVGSALSTISLYTDLALQNAGNHETLERINHAVREAAQSGNTELRATLQLLTPEAKTLETLAESLRGMARRLSPAAAIDVVVTSNRSRTPDFEASVGLAIVRIAQEALVNAVRHGRATVVKVCLAAEQDQIQLRILDNGRGFEPGDSATGRGLPGMRARAKELGATLDIESSDAGTLISLGLRLADPITGLG